MYVYGLCVSECDRQPTATASSTTLVQVVRRRRRGVSRDANTYGRRAYRDRKVTVDDIETRATELYIMVPQCIIYAYIIGYARRSRMGYRTMKAEALRSVLASLCGCGRAVCLSVAEWVGVWSLRCCGSGILTERQPVGWRVTSVRETDAPSPATRPDARQSSPLPLEVPLKTGEIQRTYIINIRLCGWYTRGRCATAPVTTTPRW